MTKHGVKLPKYYCKKEDMPFTEDCNDCGYGSVDEESNYHCAIISPIICCSGSDYECHRDCHGANACNIVGDTDDFKCPIFERLEEKR
jgi:hypothetical protein